MRYTRLFGKTVREPPREVRSRSQSLLIQAGYIRPLGRGLYSELPLATRVMQRLIDLIRGEMEQLGGQEVRVPLVNPDTLWRRGGRSEFIDRSIARFTDHQGRDFVLSPSHEEAMVQLVKDSLHAYRDFPVFLYQFQTKFRDEAHTRFGMIRAKEFTMKDGYSFHRSSCELNNFFPRVFAAYERIFRRCGIECLSAESGIGFMGGEKAYEFLMPSDSGDNIVVVCDHCGYRANRDIAKGIKPIHEEEMLDVEPVQTPGCTTMQRLAESLDVPTSRLAKPLVYNAKGKLVMAVVRGDYEVSEEKLSNYLSTPIHGLAATSDLNEHGLIPGYLSPVDRDDILVVVDDSVVRSRNLVCGANTEGRHLLNVNFPRDFFSEHVADIALVNDADRCLQCHRPMRTERAIEVGNIFKLGDFYTRRLGLHVQDERSRLVYPHMGSYGIGLGRLLSCIVETHADDRGIRWPEHLAPYQIFLMGIGPSPSVRRLVEMLYREYETVTLLDDRSESPGVKFQDADLLGIPLRVVVSPHLLERNMIEIRDRNAGRTEEVSTEEVSIEGIRELLDTRIERAAPDALGRN